MRRSSRLSKRKELEEEVKKQAKADSESSDDGDEEPKSKKTRKVASRGKAVATKKKAPAKKSQAKPKSTKAKPKAAKASPRRSGRKRKAAEEDEVELTPEEEEEEKEEQEAKEEEDTGPVRRSKRLRAAQKQSPAKAKKVSDDDDDAEEEEEDGEEEEEDGGEEDDSTEKKKKAKPALTWGEERKKMLNDSRRGRRRGPAQLVRSNSYSANDLINASYRDLFGLGAVPRAPPPRRPTPVAAPATATADGDDAPAPSRDRWVLLQHHHWLLKQVQEDGRVEAVTNFNNFGMPQQTMLEELDEDDGVGEDHTTGPQVYTDEEGALPLYYDPPADGSSCFDELPTETVMHIFSFFNAAWKGLLSDSFFWKRQYLVAEPLVLKPYNNWGWNQFHAYAMRFIRDEPIVDRECAIADVQDLTQYHNAAPANPNLTDYEFDEVYHQDPVTGCGQYMLNRNDKYLDKKFGLGLLVFTAGGWGGGRSFRSDGWWLEHYMIGSRREEDLLRTTGKYKSLCNPKLWRWRLLHSDGKDEVTGVLLLNIGYLEQLVDEGRWQDELTKVDVQFLYNVMNDAATSTDFRAYEQQSIPHWLQCHKREQKQRRIEERKMLRESQENGKGKEKASAVDESSAMDVEVSSQEGTLVEIDKPFRHTKPEAVVSKLYSYQLESLTWMTEIEDRVSRGMYWEAVRLIGFPDNIGTHIYMSPDGTALSTYEQLDKYKHFVRIYTRGGILAEEMGLGKTLIILALITLQRQNIEKIFARDEALFPLADNMFRTKATLVLCPSHLAKQWETEVLVISTILQHRNVTYKDILEADLVVVSFSFLVNKNYEGVRPSCQPSSLGNDDPKLAQRRSPLLTQFRWMRMVLDEAHELPMGVGRKGKTGIDDISPIQATFRWYITGSPFPHGRTSLHNALDLLRLKVKKPIDPDQKKKDKTPMEKNEEEGLGIQNLRYGVTYMPSVELEVMKNLYCRHTKQSVSSEYTLPGVQTQVVLLRQTVVERALYEVAKIEKRDDEMRQLCCHPQLSNSHLRMGGVRDKNLWDLFGETLVTKKQQIKSTSTALDLARTNVQAHEKHLRDLKTDWKRQRAWLPNWKPTKGELERKLGLKNSIRKEKKEISSLEASLEMYEKSLAHLEEVNAKYDIVKQGKKMAKGKPFDSKLEKEDQKEGLAILEAATNALPSAIEDMVAVHGSKMPHLLLFVQQLCEDDDSRIIIFSQWTRLLLLIGNLLEDHGVRTIFCRGNVYQRNKAIAAFQKSVDSQPKKAAKGKEPEPLPRVLMLSLENAASGTNLTQASHIILVDPICGSRSRAHAIEAQAIGRAHRLGQTQKLTVVRFLVVDTVEHETYLRNYVTKQEDDDEDEQVQEPVEVTSKSKDETNPL
ncbi:SNF2 domain containing protein [Acanthamoeba castellanii str. Neff]|uniref:SNF2 domain containing protein n=1 Tax=Acanthamoeba castellanii (strain ATCC 30010 / Neff) TaxID=1257118 RepID=L8GQR1_ACACF|nr:SNF2 domain containing protein [Acanthamoeba castellanii str. Neff]ELR15494.1 SNF2 domain containing protein [Acanthamoeba castellanii str. Neff]